MIGRISEKERRLIYTVRLNSRMPIESIAKFTGMKSHSVRYMLHSLKERKIIKPFVVINLHAIGLTDYCVFLRTEGATPSMRQKLIKICLSTNVGYLSELTGQYQWSFSLFGSSALPLENLLFKISEALPGVGVITSLAIRTEWSLLNPGYLFPGAKAQPEVRRKPAGAVVKIEPIDYKILGALSAHPDSSYLALARELQMPEATLRRHTAKLIGQKVIVGFVNEVDSEALGLNPYRVLIRCRHNNNTFREQLYKYACKHPLVTQFVRCLGPWDYEVNFEVARAQLAGDFVQELYNAFGAQIHSVELLNHLALHLVHSHPLAAFAA